MAEILRAFDHSYNRLEAAGQDYELARLEYDEVCFRLDCTLAEDVDRYRAAADRLVTARERWVGMNHDEHELAR